MNRSAWVGVVVGLAVLAGIYYVYFRPEPPPEPEWMPPPSSADDSILPDPEEAASDPPILHPMPDPVPEASGPDSVAGQTPKPAGGAPSAESPGVATLPELEASDEAAGAAMRELFGAAPVEAFLIPRDLIRRIVLTVDSLDREPLPLWLRPVVGGLAVGCIGYFLPQILGVGYEATDEALWGRLSLAMMLTLIVAKTAATSITLASRFGGGVFSPSLYLGAMTGGAYGIIAASAFPDLASSSALYSFLGMGAVVGAVLGAPISTTLIVFELTGGYELSIALLLTVAIAHGINQAIHGHSYFNWQLEMRGIFVQAGPQQIVGRNVKVMDFMTPLSPDDEPVDYDKERSMSLKPTDTLDKALRIFDTGGASRLPVVDEKHGTHIIAWATHVNALAYFNKRLIDVAKEEHL